MLHTNQYQLLVCGKHDVISKEKSRLCVGRIAQNGVGRGNSNFWKSRDFEKESCLREAPAKYHYTIY